MNNNTATFFLSWREALKSIDMPRDQMHALIVAIIDYQLYGQMPMDGELSVIANAFFISWLPVMTKSRGAPYGNQNASKKNDTHTEAATEVLNHINERIGTKYKATEGTLKLIKDRMAEGYTVSDCIQAFDNACVNPYLVQNPQFLNYETPFRGGKFEKYLNQQSQQSRCAIDKDLETTNPEIANFVRDIGG